MCNSVEESYSSSCHHVDGDLPISVSSTLEYIQKLGDNSACGTDALHAKVLKAGGLPLAIAVNKIEVRSIDEETIPARWKGGRLVDLFKQKGSAADCCNSRGLLVSDHLAKAYVGKLRDSSKEERRSTLPHDQY